MLEASSVQVRSLALPSSLRNLDDLMVEASSIQVRSLALPSSLRNLDWCR
jgi:hypothetical protein